MKESLIIKVPQKIISEDFYMRCPQEGDGQQFFEACQETPDLTLWIPFAITEGLPDQKKSEEMVIKGHADFLKREHLRYYMFDNDHRFLGFVVYPRLNWGSEIFEVGYWVRKSCEGRGLARRATQILTQLAFEHFLAKKVILVCNAENVKSRNLAEKLGYKIEEIRVNKDKVTSQKITCRDEVVYFRSNLDGLEKLSYRLEFLV